MNISQLFFFSFLLVSQVNSTTEMVEQTCKSCAAKSTVFDYSFCVSSLNNSQTTNLASLALIPMLQALDNATATVSTIQQLMSDGGGFEDDGFRRGCLRDCLELYEDAAERLEEAVEVYINKEERETVNVMVSAAMEAAVTCEDGFSGGGGGGGVMTWTSPIGAENYKLFELGQIALCIINMLSSATSLSF